MKGESRLVEAKVGVEVLEELEVRRGTGSRGLGGRGSRGGGGGGRGGRGGRL